MRTRKPILIDPRDQSRLLAGLERGTETGDFLDLRIRAFMYLLWDGALRPGLAVALDIEDVVKDPVASRIQVLEEAVLHSCEATQYRKRPFLISPRARDAIAAYLKVARSEGWLASPKRLEGPLWISTHHHGTQQRMSQRTAMQAWHTLQQGLSGLSQEYQLDDVMLTARVEFMRRVKGSRAAEILAEHAGISSKWAGHYSDHLSSAESSAREVARDVISQLGQKPKRKHG
jgi:integrase